MAVVCSDEYTLVITKHSTSRRQTLYKGHLYTLTDD